MIQSRKLSDIPAGNTSHSHFLYPFRKWELRQGTGKPVRNELWVRVIFQENIYIYIITNWFCNTSVNSRLSSQALGCNTTTLLFITHGLLQLQSTTAAISSKLYDYSKNLNHKTSFIGQSFGIPLLLLRFCVSRLLLLHSHPLTLHKPLLWQSQPAFTSHTALVLVNIFMIFILTSD